MTTNTGNEVQVKITGDGKVLVTEAGKAATALDQVGRAAVKANEATQVSAAQTAAAMRMLPMQFTDVITQLAGGQNPLLILIQQGGQIKDSFGGIGPMIEGVGAALSGTMIAIGAAAVVVGGLGYAFYTGSKEVSEFNKTLAFSGNIAGVTSDQLMMMARGIGDQVGTQGAAAEALNLIAGSGKIAADSMQRYGEVAIRVSKATGKEVGDVVKEFASLADAPVAGSIKLNETYHYLTAAVLEQIKALELQGKRQDAVKLAQDSFADASARMSGQVVENLGWIASAWKGIGSAAKDAMDYMANIGRDAGKLEELATLQARYNSLTRNVGNFSGQYEAKGLLPRINALKTEIELDQQKTKADKARLDIQESGVRALEKVDVVQEKGLKKQQLLNIALEQYRKNLEAIRKSNPSSDRLTPEAIARGEAALREQYKETETKPRQRAGAVGSPTDTAIANLQAKIDAAKQELAWGERLNEGQREALRLSALIDLATKSEVRSALEKQRVKANELAAQLEINAAAKTYTESQKKQDEERKRELDQLSASALQWQNKVQFYGMGEAALDSYTLAQLNATIAEKEALATRIQDTGELAKEIKFLKEKAAILAGKVTAQTEFEGLEAADKAAKDFAAARKQEADDLQGFYRGVFQSMEDSMVSYATGGGMSFKGMIDSMIQDLIRYQIRQSLIKPLMEVIGGGSGGGGGGLGGLLGMGLSMIGSMFGGQTAAPSFTDIGNSGGFVPFANGGVMTDLGPLPLRKYANGGIARSPQLALYGEAGPEAYVPLPDGRSIPVTLGGNPQQSSQPITVVISPQIDARGADAGAVERIEAALARLASSVPDMATAAVRGAMTRARQTPNF